MEASSRPILLVEDDPECRAMLTLVLELEGYPVVAAVNGREALTLAQQHQPALIVLDLMMPVMGGEEFRTRQLTTPAIEDIPVVIVSARYDAHKIATRLNAAACLGKPIDVDALTMVVRSAITGGAEDAGAHLPRL